jgi:hypothetical protein
MKNCVRKIFVLETFLFEAEAVDELAEKICT